MIEFIEPTDGIYDVGQRVNFAPSLEELYVKRKVAKYVEPEPVPAAKVETASPTPMKTKFSDIRQNRMVDGDKVAKK